MLEFSDFEREIIVLPEKAFIARLTEVHLWDGGVGSIIIESELESADPSSERP